MPSEPGCRALRALLVLSLIGISTTGCKKRSGTWPDEKPDVVNVAYTAGTKISPPAVTSQVTVAPGSLTFPPSMATMVADEFPVGAAVVGAPSDAGDGKNPFGYLRKVVSVSSANGGVVVATQPAALQDVLTGTFRGTVAQAPTPIALPDGFNLDDYFPPDPIGPGARRPGAKFGPSPVSSDLHGSLDFSQGFQLSGTIPIFNIAESETVTVGGHQIPLTFGGSATLTTDFSFTPELRLEFETGVVAGLEHLLVEAAGAYAAKTSLDVTVTLAPPPETPKADLEGITTALLALPPIELTKEITLAKSPPYKGPNIDGVPTSFVVGLYADCAARLFGSMSAHTDSTVSANLAAGFAYGTYKDDNGNTAGTKDKWTSISTFDVPIPPTHVSITSAKGGVQLECGVTARVDWLIGGVGGPYLGLRGALTGTVTYGEQCVADRPTNGFADSTVGFKLDGELDVQLGGKIDAWHVVDIERGPINLYTKPFDGLYSASKTIPAAGLGWCAVQCQDGVKDGNETDVDCGANCLPCSHGKACGKGSDCLSTICAVNGTCAGSLCEDGLKNGSETDIDCGGTTCQPCQLGLACARDADCAEGFCSKPGAGPRVCTTNLCLDAKKDGNESDVDCGSAPGCANLCASGQGCFSAADCQTGACNVNSLLCVDSTCADGAVDNGETDIDCGGPCGTKCATGKKCDFWQHGADCASSICSVYDVCVASYCQNGLTDQDETDVDCGGSSCSARCALNQICASNSDCDSALVCNPHSLRCVQPGCFDGEKNNGETSADCGGPNCAKCALSKTCEQDSDCLSGVCSGGRCVATTCDNGVKDSNEADVDCGGACSANKCGQGKSCGEASDCLSNICSGGKCVSDPCLDKVRNGSETDVDCGGSCATASAAGKCAAGKGCAQASDCLSGLCNATSKTCALDQCHDGVKDGAEVDVDCGGGCAALCAVNQHCGAGGDCASGVCNGVTQRCVPNDCFDGTKDDSETDVDCGGSCQAKCGATKSCVLNTDCQSGACNLGTHTCAADQCSDGKLDGSETDVDCGGAVCQSRCQAGQGCLSGNDCVNPQGLVGVAGYCSRSTRLCSSSSCGDGAQDGDETGHDCGGPTCAPQGFTCALGDGCAADSDCQSGHCNEVLKQCVSSACQDGRTDGTETDIDCGGGNGTGGCGQSCSTSAHCASDLDCQSGRCNDGTHLCDPTLPRTCLEVYNSGQHADGVYLLKPDGPRSLNNPGFGTAAPISTFCDMTGAQVQGSSGGGWTPVGYYNSGTLYDARIFEWWRIAPGNNGGTPNYDLNRYSWWDPLSLCNSDADCAASTSSNPPRPAGMICDPRANSPQGYTGTCVARSTQPGLASAPINYSLQSSDVTTLPLSYWMDINNRGYNPYGGAPGVTPFGAQLRWDVYRDGHLLWSTPVFSRNFRDAFIGEGTWTNYNALMEQGYITDPGTSGTSNLFWLRCANNVGGSPNYFGDGILSTPTVLEDNPEPYGPSNDGTTCTGTNVCTDTNCDQATCTNGAENMNFRCHGWADYTGTFYTGQSCGSRCSTNYRPPATATGSTDYVMNFFEENPLDLDKRSAANAFPDTNLLWGGFIYRGVTLSMGACNTPGGCGPPGYSGWYYNSSGQSVTGGGAIVYHVGVPGTSGNPLIAQGTGSSGELAGPTSGTHLSYNTAGLVFVLWAK